MALFSASFQMSYGVVLAILSFGLPLAYWLAAQFTPFRNLPEVTWAWWQKMLATALRWFWPVLGIGLAAALVSTVTGPEFFRVWAPAGLVSNLVIVAGFAAVAAGLVGATGLGTLFNHAAIVILWASMRSCSSAYGCQVRGGRQTGARRGWLRLRWRYCWRPCLQAMRADGGRRAGVGGRRLRWRHSGCFWA